mmetsp:Transcript_98273/g.286618  ORF Transcript_98273/g.286618 Transcript_98273/m.286618 type:complete len:201 (+) Transcript_98273:258-860(+)
MVGCCAASTTSRRSCPATRSLVMSSASMACGGSGPTGASAPRPADRASAGGTGTSPSSPTSAAGRRWAGARTGSSARRRPRRARRPMPAATVTASSLPGTSGRTAAALASASASDSASWLSSTPALGRHALGARSRRCFPATQGPLRRLRWCADRPSVTACWDSGRSGRLVPRPAAGATMRGHAISSTQRRTRAHLALET